MVQRSTDNIFRDVRPAHPKYPIQHSDKIHANRCLTRLYCCRPSSDLCASNQSIVGAVKNDNEIENKKKKNIENQDLKAITSRCNLE